MSKEAKSKLPYPGKSGCFKHAAGNWEKYDSGGPLNRYLEFRADANACLVEFALLGYKDGDIRISLKWNDKFSKSVVEFLQSYEFTLRHSDTGQLVTKNNTETHTMFHILTAHNQIAENYLNKIRTILERECPVE